jgi:hypothetical protein
MNLSAQRARKFLGLLLLAAVACAVVSCESVETNTKANAGATHYSATDPANVAVLRSEPTQPYDRIGEIALDASTSPSAPLSEIQEKFRTGAARMGADAVILVSDRVEPPGVYLYDDEWWDYPVQVGEEHKIVGIAIKYR